MSLSWASRRYIIGYAYWIKNFSERNFTSQDTLTCNIKIDIMQVIPLKRDEDVTSASKIVISLMTCIRKCLACPYMSVGVPRIRPRRVSTTFRLELSRRRTLYDKFRKYGNYGGSQGAVVYLRQAEVHSIPPLWCRIHSSHGSLDVGLNE